MVGTKSLSERERTAKLIAKTRAWIRKKHRALKTGIMKKEIVLEKQLNFIIEPLKQIVGNTAREGKPVETKFMRVSERINDEEVFETGDNPSLETSVRQALNTPQGRQRLQSQLGPLGQVYVNTLLIGNARNEIDLVYGVYFDENGTMLGNKKFDVNTDDTIIIDGERYKGTPGLYELIFKKIPNDAIYTENDKQTYKHILLTTNAHRRDNNARRPIKSNKGHKYKNIIVPLLVTRSVSGTSIGSGIKTNPLPFCSDENNRGIRATPSPMYVGNLTLRFGRINNLPILRLETSTAHWILNLEYCVNRLISSLIAMTDNVDTKFSRLLAIASTVTKSTNMLKMMYDDESFDCNNILDCELIALIFGEH
ncbi:hypothetical protein ALC57_14540 [Trachymyrmex cornetzi]|uniref:DUF8207 domain-containing protein n=1 Tax=Trachymyrmex cornetzi TaxID=471704 RepID=A0A151IYC6_9HYME|nr:hypothetical protein ALC57_14540 [Trachymyrmex cornetzi]